MTNLPMLFINIFTGGALIICGSFLLSRTLEALSEKKMPLAFKSAGNSPVRAFFVSLIVTAVVQSSSVITTLSVSLAESGILSLYSAMAVVYGANIGTTITAQLMSFDISSVWPVVILAALLLKAVSFATGRARRAADALLAIGLVFAGLGTLSQSARLIKESDFIMNFISLYGRNTLGGVFFGFLTTALAHSSSATVGLTIAMFSGGVIGFEQAVAITLGDNIGTCITAQFAAIASGRRGRQVAWGHTLYNIITAAIVLLFMDGFLAVVSRLTSFAGQSQTFLVANAHTLLNVLGAMLFLPLNGYFCRFLEIFTGEGE